MVAKIQKGSISLDYETDPLLRHKSAKAAAADDSSTQNQSESVRRLPMSANTLQRVSKFMFLCNSLLMRVGLLVM